MRNKANNYWAHQLHLKLIIALNRCLETFLYLASKSLVYVSRLKLATIVEEPQQILRKPYTMRCNTTIGRPSVMNTHHWYACTVRTLLIRSKQQRWWWSGLVVLAQRNSETPSRNVRSYSDSANSLSDSCSLFFALTYKKKRKKGTEGGNGVK